MEKKSPAHLRHLKNTRDGIRIESDGLAKTSSKMKAAHLLGLASAIAGGHTPTETSVSRHFNTRNAIMHATHVSRATLNRPDGDALNRRGHGQNPVSSRLYLTRKVERKLKRKARMRLRARRGRWC